MTAEVSGTFANGGSVGVGIRGDVLVIPSGYTSMQTWTDQTTYNSAQTDTAVTVAHGEQWVLETVAGQASKQITYRMECDG